MRDLEGFEITYALSVNRWGQGLAHEAASAMLFKAFRELGLEQVFGLVFPQNLRSIRVLKKLGMNFVRNHFDQTTQQGVCLYCANFTDFLGTQPSSK
jgi:ribosomal-protein-alanine N-acetyltransferase